MTLEENRALVTRYFEGDHDGRDNTEHWHEVCSPDMALYASVLPAPVHGLDAIIGFTRSMHDAFEGFALRVEQSLAEGDAVAVRWRMTGTNTGPIMLPSGDRLDATGASIDVTGMSFMRVSDGRIVEERTEADWMGLLQQLGAVPSPA